MIDNRVYLDNMRLNLGFIWKTVQEDIPALKPQMLAILADLDRSAGANSPSQPDKGLLGINFR